MYLGGDDRIGMGGRVCGQGHFSFSSRGVIGPRSRRLIGKGGFGVCVTSKIRVDNYG